MSKKSTKELENALGSTHVSDFEKFYHENKDHMNMILRICYAAECTLEETQKALRKYEMPQLYAKVPRDALLMIIFNERPGSIIDANALLKKNGMEPLRTSGMQE